MVDVVSMEILKLTLITSVDHFMERVITLLATKEVVIVRVDAWITKCIEDKPVRLAGRTFMVQTTTLYKQ